MKWIKKTYLQCIPLHFGIWLSFTVFLALLRNHCYSFHRRKWRLVTSICRGPGPVATRMPFFRRNSNPLQIYSIQDYVHPGDHIQPTYEMTPGFKPLAYIIKNEAFFIIKKTYVSWQTNSYLFFVSNKGKRISKLEKAAKNFVVEIYSVGKWLS